MQARRRMIGNASQYVGEPGARIDVVEFGGNNERIHCCCPLTAAVAAGKPPSFAAKSHATQAACICIVRQTNPTIVEKACESLRVAGSDKLPMLWRQACQTGRGRHRDAGEHPAPLQSDPNGAGEVLCRTCETITQPLAPFHPIVRGRAGPDLLATIMHAKFGEHQPLNRQSERFAREGIDLSVSTLADWVGACTTALSPLVALIHAHVLAAERIHGDDTTVPVLARGKTITGRLWIYVRDDRPFGGPS
jgi:hypothetical protein